MPRIVLVGEAWGENEDLLKQPFVGTSGVELLRMMSEAELLPLTDYDEMMIENYWRSRDPHMVALVWAAHKEFFPTNVFNFRPAQNNDIKAICGKKVEGIPGYPALQQGKYPLARYAPELVRLNEEIERERPNLIIALGNTASWALIKQTAISRIRGTVFQTERGFKVLPTFHPSGVLRQYETRHVTVLDFVKARRESLFPEVRRPQRFIHIAETLQDLETYYDQVLARASSITFDVETAARQITCIGFSASPQSALVIPFVDSRRAGNAYWASAEEEVQAWNFVRRVLDHPAPKIAQNGLYDISFLWRGYGITVRNMEHDTMLLHHALQPESPKGLGFLGSVYTDEPAWKLMRDRGKGTIKREDD